MFIGYFRSAGQEEYSAMRPIHENRSRIYLCLCSV